MTVDMSVNFTRRFLIRSSGYLGMEFDLGGRIDIVKEMNEELQLFGTLNSTDGYVSPLGKQFEIEEAAVSFFGPVTNPQLSITSSYTPPQAAGVEIRYVIEGTLEEPEFRFESDPPLSLQDQISYTLFGKPYYELESWEQVISGSGSSPTAQDLALDVLLDRVSMLATRQLGIDVVEIDQSRSGSNNTVIKTGWYLNEDTFFAILNEIDGVRPNTLFVLEYLLRENLELVITQGDDNRQGIDLRWHKDY
jgi:autotransporter translocation and assembly factor TamB